MPERLPVPGRANGEQPSPENLPARRPAALPAPRRPSPSSQTPTRPGNLPVIWQRTDRDVAAAEASAAAIAADQIRRRQAITAKLMRGGALIGAVIAAAAAAALVILQPNPETATHTVLLFATIIGVGMLVNGVIYGSAPTDPATAHTGEDTGEDPQ